MLNCRVNLPRRWEQKFLISEIPTNAHITTTTTTTTIDLDLDSDLDLDKIIKNVIQTNDHHSDIASDLLFNQRITSLR